MASHGVAAPQAAWTELQRRYPNGQWAIKLMVPCPMFTVDITLQMASRGRQDL
jgi:hypothetical protein